MKNLKFRQKFLAARCIFNSFFGVLSGDETLRLMLDTQRVLNGQQTHSSPKRNSAASRVFPTLSQIISEFKNPDETIWATPDQYITHTCELLPLYKFLDLVLYCDLDDELKTAHSQRNREYYHAWQYENKCVKANVSELKAVVRNAA